MVAISPFQGLRGARACRVRHRSRGRADRLAALIDHILAARPGVELLVAQIITEQGEPHASMANAYNAAIPGIVQGKGPHVHLVDMHSALTEADLADGVHPSRAGYDKMATVWYDALRSVPGSLEPLPAATGAGASAASAAPAGAR